MEKPPIGIKPKVFWEEERMLELSKVIYKHIKRGYYWNVLIWTEELLELMEHKNGN